MGMPQYFSYLPNIEYTVSINRAGNESNITIKDYFHLLKVRDDIFKDDTIYELYNVRNGQRPEQISYELYGDTRYYWILLQINGIVDYYNQWPLNNSDLDKFILKKYGSYEKSGATRHYETVETKNSRGDVILEEGIKVSENFVFEFPDNPGQFVYKTSRPVPISYRQFEYRLNETKSQINVLNPDFVIRYEEECRDYYRKMRKTVVKSQLDVNA